MKMHLLLSLPHLFVKQIRRKEPLLDYSQSHVMTSAEYLTIMHKKVMEKAIVEVIRVTHRTKGKKIGLKNLQLISMQMNGHFNV
jgi:hypothetical protein